MAKEEAHPAPSSGDIPGSGGGSKGPLLLMLVNTLVILATAVLMYYTKMLFKRPPITETHERTKLAEEHAKKRKKITEPGLVNFDQITINIETSPPAPKSVEVSSKPVAGKLHYATMSFSLEVSDYSRKDEVEALRPKILDDVISLLGRKSFTELTTVQGRYLIKTQIMDTINRLLAGGDEHGDLGKKPAEAKENADPAIISNVYFSQFMVQ